MRAGTLARTAAAVVATAVTGSAATDPRDPWYLALDKPAWQPPPVAFPVVWTALYADVALASAAAIDGLEQAGRADEARAYRRALAANLVLNAGWSWLFFRARRPWLAAAECAVLAVNSADLVRRTARVNQGAAAALTPYAAWCGFATALTAAIAVKNPGA
ncbi:TspO/MBR family protein [Georgenia thermotolerans]|uniref:Tryptophan-rich sensory protein n=1 Tax=Georgenia thermotolerans TaxID=527326 RepID=A0A7J5ULU7_9MICO|nr:TspO/MBR family protein [Georgenia thermotolerans]KAE8763359.1 tryptophan-rich sensory protein [Georgenia thermotolerans]